MSGPILGGREGARSYLYLLVDLLVELPKPKEAQLVHPVAQPQLPIPRIVRSRIG